MKDLFILLGFFCLAASCRSLQPATSRSKPSPATRDNNSVQFIDNIAINPGSSGNGSKTESIPTSNKHADKKNSNNSAFSDLQIKYAILENAPVEELTNTRLLQFMDDWYGTQYHYGGTSKDGIDCSAFVSLLVAQVYDISGIPRTSRDQYNQTRRIKKSALKEGDLVFFHTQSGKHVVSHVGIYLRNNKFVHASVSGVMISDMDQGYYAQHYVGAGRIGEMD